MILPVIYLVAYAIINASGLVLIRLALKQDTTLTHSGSSVSLLDPRLIAGVALYGVSFVMWIASLRRYPISMVYPLFIGVGYIATLVGAFAFLHETASTIKLLGVVFIGAGAILIVR